MMRPRLAVAAALVGVLALAACSSPAASSPPAGGTNAPPAATSSVEQTDPPVAGEPCSYLTAEEIRSVLGAAPVEVEERAGRGDCDYWLTPAKGPKINVGVTLGADGASIFESTKGLGSPAPVDLGDDAYMIVDDNFGVIVVVKQGDAVASIQVFTEASNSSQVAFAIALAKKVVAKL